MGQDSTYEMRSRTEQEQIEEKSLAPYACKSCSLHFTRLRDEPEHAYRTCFQRDRDRVIHSRSFRRLKHKRQVFLTSEGDHYRTRMTHTLEVAQLARTMARSLKLNEDLVEAIALGHDLGHTPFGHLGEDVLDKIMSGKRVFTGQARALNFGGFKHNYQSIRVVDLLERKYSYPGLNLTAPVREGVLKHTRIKRGRFDFPEFDYRGLHFEMDHATTLEGQVVAICDEIAQRTHDLEDGIRAGLVAVEKVEELEIVRKVKSQLGIDCSAGQQPLLYAGMLVRGLLNLLMDDVIGESLRNVSIFEEKKKRLNNFDEELVRFGQQTDGLQKTLNKFIYKEIIQYSRVKWSDELGEELLFRLFQAYFLEPALLPKSLLSHLAPTVGSSYESLFGEEFASIRNHAPFFRAVCDYIAGMTDQFAASEATALAALGKLRIDDLNLESATAQKIKVDRALDDDRN